jgi:CMP-N,N'-diacetyllegionaminic acid synthase
MTVFDKSIAPDFLVLVPARKGSKRLPNKNRFSIGNRSLLWRTLDAIKTLGLSEQTVISTDDEVVAAEAIRLGFPVPTLRPSHLAQDNTSTFDVLKHVLADIEKQQKWSPKYVLLLQLTSPFRDPEIISRAIDLIQKKNKFSAIVSGKVNRSRNEKTIGFAADHVLSYTTDNISEFVEADGNFYVVRVSELIKYGTFLPKGTKVIVSDQNQSIDIDTLQDFELAQDVWRNTYQRY